MEKSNSIKLLAITNITVLALALYKRRFKNEKKIYSIRSIFT